MSLAEICEDFAELDQPTDRFQYLVELGDSLSPFPDDCRTEGNRVLGCQSMVWLVGSKDGSNLSFRATSDAPLVRGLIALLLAAYSGKSPQQIVEFPVEELFGRLKLNTFLTHSRSNGLHSMVRRIQGVARDELDRSGLSASAQLTNLPTTSRNAKSSHEVNSHEVKATDWDRIRDDFPILSRVLESGQKLIYLDNAATTQRPRSVIQTMVTAYEQYFSNVHRGGHTLASETTQRYEDARRTVQEFIHAESADEIIFTSGTTASINLVAHSWGENQLPAGSRILLTEMEHHSNIVPWQQLAARKGCTIDWVRIDDKGELDLDDLDRHLQQPVGLMSVVSVSNVLGTVNPIAEIVRRAHDVGACVVVDAAQSAPHQILDVRESQADFVAFSGHKMLGPTGIGILYGRRAILQALPPFLGGGSMIQSVSKRGFEPAELPFRFEAGTPNIVGAIGMASAIDYLRAIGMDRIHQREKQLNELAHQHLASIPEVRVLGPSPQRKGGIVTFVVDGVHASEVAQVLDTQGVAVRAGHHCAMPLHERMGISASCRASFYFYNTDDDVRQLADGISEAKRLLRRR